MRLIEIIKNRYRALRKFLLKKRLHFSEKKKWFYMAYQKNWMIDPCTDKRQKYWKKCGAHINGQVYIGYDVYFDAYKAHLITIDDGAFITSRCLLLCHKRDMDYYCMGKDIGQLPLKEGAIHIGKDARLGMGTIVMPGVTIGEGAATGAGSVVTHDVPAWTVVAGNPARIIRTAPPTPRIENSDKT